MVLICLFLRVSFTLFIYFGPPSWSRSLHHWPPTRKATVTNASTFTQTHFKTCHHSLTMYRRLWLRLSLSVFKGVHKLAGVGAIWTGTSRNRPTETGAAEHEISFFTVSNVVLSQNSLWSNSHCSLHVLATCVSVYRFEVLAVHLFDVRTLGVEVELPWQIVWPGHPDWAYIKRFLGGWSVCHIWRLNSYCRYFHAPQIHHSLHSWWNNLMNNHIKLKLTYSK